MGRGRPKAGTNPLEKVANALQDTMHSTADWKGAHKVEEPQIAVCINKQYVLEPGTNSLRLWPTVEEARRYVMSFFACEELQEAVDGTDMSAWEIISQCLQVRFAEIKVIKRHSKKI